MNTQQSLREMKGPALTREAYRLGLAPYYVQEGGMTFPASPGYEGPGYWSMDHWEAWEPHQNIMQADACLRHVRLLGWVTRVTGWRDGGEVYAEKQLTTGEYAHERIAWPLEAPCEAHALLLLSVLVSRGPGRP